MIALRRTKISIFSMILTLLPGLFISCSNESDLPTDLKNDYSANFTFYSDNPEASSDFFSVNQLFEIGRTVYAEKDFPDANSAEFKARKPGYKLKGWVYYKNPLSTNKDSEKSEETEETEAAEKSEESLESYIELNSDGTVKKMLVVSVPASFYVNQWEPISYSVTFYGNGGTDSGGKSEQTQANFVYDEATGLNVNPFKRDAYYFTGWGMSEDQKPNFPTYTDGQTVMNLTSNEGENLKLYALWMKGKVKISFDPGEGSGSIETKEYNIGDQLPDWETVNSLLTAPADKILNGWTVTYTDAEGHVTGSSFYHPGQILDAQSFPEKDVTLVAQWNYPIYMVEFNSNYEEPVSPQWIEKGKLAAEPEIIPRTGYTLDGWYTDSTFETKFSFSTPITEDKHLVAKWTPETRIVRFDLAGGTGSFEDVTITYDYLPYFPMTAPSKDGYIFNGWNPGAITAENWSTETITMVAKWRERGSIEGNLPANIEVEYIPEGMVFRAIGTGSYSSFQWLIDGSTVQNSLDNSITILYSDAQYADHARHTVAVIGVPDDTETDVLTAGFKFRID